MTLAESKEVVKWVVGLFPSMTKEQAILAVEEFQRYKVEDVRAVVRDHRFLHEFFEFGQFRHAMNARLNGKRDEWEERRAQEQMQREMIEGARRVVAGLPDADLQKLKQVALEKMTPDEKGWYEKRDPRTTTSLAMAIVELAMK